VGVDVCGRGYFASYVVLLAQLLGEGGAHDVAASGRAGAEVGFARLAPRGGEACGFVSMVTVLCSLDFVPESTFVMLGGDEVLSRGVVLRMVGRSLLNRKNGQTVTVGLGAQISFEKSGSSLSWSWRLCPGESVSWALLAVGNLPVACLGASSASFPTTLHMLLQVIHIPQPRGTHSSHLL
jgi:hypothetical protein